MPLAYQSMNIAQYTPKSPRPTYEPSIFASMTRKIHIEEIATIMVNLTSPEALRKLGVVNAIGQKSIDCMRLSLV